MLSESVATVDELRDYMSGIQLYGYQEEIARVILDGVQSELEKYINRPIGLRHVREVNRTDAYGVLNVRHSPVHRIVSVRTATYMPLILTTLAGGKIEVPTEMEPQYTPDGEEIPRNDGFLLNPDTSYAYVNSPSIIPGGIEIGMSDTDVVVEYIAGYVGALMPSIKLAVLRVASREMERMHDDTRSLRGGVQDEAVDSTPTPRGWQEDELQQFDRIRRRSIASG